MAMKHKDDCILREIGSSRKFGEPARAICTVGGGLGLGFSSYSGKVPGL
jgi:hypothetical protein